MRSACRSLLACQAGSSERRGGKSNLHFWTLIKEGLLIWSPISFSKSSVSHRRALICFYKANGELANWESRNIVCGFWEASMWNFACLLQSAATSVYFCHSYFLLHFSFVTVVVSGEGLFQCCHGEKLAALSLVIFRFWPQLNYYSLPDTVLMKLLQKPDWINYWTVLSLSSGGVQPC